MAGRKGEASPDHHLLKVDSETFKKEFTEIGASGISKKYGMSEKSIYSRRRYIEEQQGVSLLPPTRGGHVQQLDQHPGAVQLGLQDGYVLIGSDSHYWPDVVSTAHNAFVALLQDPASFGLPGQPKVIIKNGDEMDFPSLSKFAPIAWEKRPSVADEIDNTRSMLSEIKKASPRSRRIWPLGNHDGRFESRLATLAPELARTKGVHLKDHIPDWETCWAALINESVVIKHRFKSGLHAPHNNTIWAGRSIVTGHLHSMKTMPVTDYNGTRYGVDCGTMADPYGPQFYNYTELNPVNWRSGFCVLTIHKGAPLWPEFVFVRGPGEVEFRGKVYSV